MKYKDLSKFYFIYKNNIIKKKFMKPNIIIFKHLFYNKYIFIIKI